MSAPIWKWLCSHKVLVASLALPLVSVGLAAAATSWVLGRPKPRQAFSADGLTRPLSDLESWYSSKNLAHLLPHFYVAAELKGQVWTEKEARILLSRVMARHAPSMFTIFDKDDGIHAPYWQRLWHTSYAPEEQGIIDIRFESRATDVENDTSWRNFAERHEADGFSVSQPRHSLFRLIIVSRPSCIYWEVILFTHHAICDGRGASHFLRQLLEEWAEFQAEDASDPHPVDLAKIKIVDEVSSARNRENKDDREVVWAAPLEDRIRTTPGLWFLIKTLLKDKISFFRPKSVAWLGPKDRGTILRPTQEAKWIKVPASTVAALRSLCRQKDTTINGILWAAIIFGLLTAFRRSIRLGKEQQTGAGADRGDSGVFALQAPIDMRPRLSVSPTHLGPMVIGTTMEVKANINDKFWETARKINQQIIDDVPQAVATNGLIAYVPKPAVQWLFSREARPPNGRAETMRMSNLGVIEFEDAYGALCQVRDVWFARHGMRDQQVFMMNVLTPGKNRDMNVLLSGVPEILNEGVLQCLVDTFLQVLHHAITTPPDSDFTYLDLFSE